LLVFSTFSYSIPFVSIESTFFFQYSDDNTSSLLPIRVYPVIRVNIRVSPGIKL